MLTRDRSFYKTFIRLCLALMLEQAVILSVNLADNMMLGTYSEAALAGVAAVNQVQFVYQQVVYAIANAVIVLGSQYWGQRRMDESEISRVWASGLKSRWLCCCLCWSACFRQGVLQPLYEKCQPSSRRAWRI